MDDVPYHSTRHLLAEPAEQVLEREKEANQVQANAPLIQEIIDSLDARIAFYGSLESIPADVLDDPEKFMHQVAANKLTVANLLTEKNTLEELIRAHVR